VCVCVSEGDVMRLREMEIAKSISRSIPGMILTKNLPPISNKETTIEISGLAGLCSFGGGSFSVL